MNSNSDGPSPSKLPEDVAQLKQVVAAQSRRIESLESTLEASDNDEGEDGTGTTKSISSGFSRRSLIQAAGIAGLAGYGTGIASADPTGQIGSPDQPVRSIYTEMLGAGILEGQEITSLLGTGLNVDDGTLSAAEAAMNHANIAEDGSTVLEDVVQLDFGSNLSISSIDEELGIATVVSENPAVRDSGTTVVEDLIQLDFGANLSVSSDEPEDGGVTVDGENPTVEDSGTTILEDVLGLDFAKNLTVSDDGDGSVTVDGENPAVEDSGSSVTDDVTTLNFNDNLNLSLGNDGTVEVNSVDTDTDTNSHTNVSDDGTTVVTSTADIDFGSNLSVTDDGDGSVTVTGTTGSLWEDAGSNLLEPTGSFVGITNTDSIASSSGTALTLNTDAGTRALELGVPGTDFNTNTGGGHFLAGASANTIKSGAVGAVIGGGGSSGTGNENTVKDDYGTVGGGFGNRAGVDDNSDQQAATVAGGEDNTASAKHTTVGGGWQNSASSAGAVVAGGDSNTASGGDSFVGGGEGNTASNTQATVGGGDANTASGDHATVGGGEKHEATKPWATVSGGFRNFAKGNYATIAGGDDNDANGDSSFVGSGRQNDASGALSAIGGGRHNEASGSFSAVGGGGGGSESDGNVASGSRSVVPGGLGNTADGNYSFAAGRAANANGNNGAFVWGDSSSTTVTANSADEVKFQATGGFVVQDDGGSVAINVADKIELGKPIKFTAGTGAVTAPGTQGDTTFTGSAKDQYIAWDTAGNDGALIFAGEQSGKDDGALVLRTQDNGDDEILFQQHHSAGSGATPQTRLRIDNNGNVQIDTADLDLNGNDINNVGTLNANTKNFVETVQTSDGERTVTYTSIETPTVRTEVSGVTTVEDGSAEVELPDHFTWVTDGNEDLVVHVTAHATEAVNPQVTERSIHHIRIEDPGNEDAHYEVSYTVKGTRNGYTDKEVVADPASEKPGTSPREEERAS